jgi:hypothetical protein
MHGDPRDYMIVARYLVKDEGWKEEIVKVPNASYEVAARRASNEAKLLDAAFGGTGFDWFVDLFDDPKGQYGSYFQLFHGRLS